MNTTYSIQKRRKHGRVGQAPGSIVIPSDALPPRVSVISYNKADLQDHNNLPIDQALEMVRRQPELIHWVQIQGLGSADLVKKVGACLELNPLVLEDITDITQRPIYDEYDR